MVEAAAFDPSCRVIDLGAWVGQYPFRRSAYGSLADLATKAEALGIVQVVGSPYEAIFFEESLEAFEAWAAPAMAHESVMLWPVVNPAQPGQLKQLQVLHERYGFQGIRLLPNYHGYDLSASCMDEIMAFARAHDLIVQLFQRIADERWHWILKVAALPEKDALQFICNYPDNTILLSAFRISEALCQQLGSSEMVYADLSFMRGPTFVVEQHQEDWPMDKLVFGSLWPMQIIEATLWQITGANVPESLKKLLLYDNADRLLGTEGHGGV